MMSYIFRHTVCDTAYMWPGRLTNHYCSLSFPWSCFFLSTIQCPNFVHRAPVSGVLDIYITIYLILHDKLTIHE